MNVAVLVPYRPEDDLRAANYALTREQWGDWTVVNSGSAGEVFSRAQAINNAARLAPDADVYVITDSDLLLGDWRQAEEAASIAYSSGAYVVAFTNLIAFNHEETRMARNGFPPQDLKSMWSVSQIWGGTFAVTPELFGAVGGFDEGFVGWGYEDGAFLAACSTLAGKVRVPGTVYHLRHTDAPRDPVLMEANQKLAIRWRECDGDSKAMLALIEERR